LEVAVKIEPLDDRWRAEAEALWAERWGSPQMASRGRLHDARAMPGFVVVQDGRFAGVVTYRIEGEECEILTLDAAREGSGAGTPLLEAAAGAAREAGCRRAWLITTNDNWPAIRFYQRRGWRLAAVHRDAVTHSRAELKPSIPEHGVDGIPIRDELEFELRLDGLGDAGS
jgi:ribosomal protein S18 acetylase RimI-like enzyme